METPDPRAVDHLLAQVSVTLRRLPGAEQLFLFGSCANPALKDPYSDLDLQVISADPGASQAAFPWILNEVGAIRLAFSLAEVPEECAFSLALEGVSPYHKIDIGLDSSRNPAAFIHKVSPKVLLWQQPAAPGIPPVARDGYLPAPGSQEHFLIGELLSAVRYVKARKRGQHLTCWRFLSRKFNAWLNCLLEPEAGPRPTGLTTWDYAALDRRLPETRRLRLLSVLREQNPADMDRSLVEITQEIVKEVTPRLGEPNPALGGLVQEYLGFIQMELQVKTP